MPQEIALYGEFSIRETFIFFGWCAGMTTDQVDDKIEFLLKVRPPSLTRASAVVTGGVIAFNQRLLGGGKRFLKA